MFQFQRVNCSYGAPMGRQSDGYLETGVPRCVRLFRVALDSGGYDNGGAYWGFGTPLWCAIDDDGRLQFVRASNRAMAALALHVPRGALKKPEPLEACASVAFAVLDSRVPMPEGQTKTGVVDWLAAGWSCAVKKKDIS